MSKTTRSIQNARLFTFNMIGLVALPCLLGGDATMEQSQQRLTDNDTISISIVGDMMIGSSYPSPHLLPPEHEGNILQHAIPFLQETDLRIGNLESVISDSAAVHKKCGVTQCYAFCTPSRYARWYKEAGFEYLNLSNNHSFDFGPDGIQHTLDFLRQQQIRTSGVWQHPVDTLTVRNTRIGFVSFAPHNNCLDLNNDSLVQAYITQLRPRCDVLLVFFHGGAEGTTRTHIPRKREFYYGQDRGDVMRFAHLCVDAGADIVVGSGPHVVRGMELYKDKLIAYSLGNFATYSLFNLKHPYNLAPLLQVKITRQGALVEHKVLSFLQHGEGIPKPDTALQAMKLIKALSEQDFGYEGVN